MAHFAEINNENIVTRVLVVDNQKIMDENGNEIEEKGKEFLNSIFPNTTWIQTSYNGRIRKNYAGIGYSYDVDIDGFIPPKPYVSWILNVDSCQWEAPTPMPTDGHYFWNENILEWIIVNE